MPIATYQSPPAPSIKLLRTTPEAVVTQRDPNWVIRYAYYSFIFSVPFEAAHVGATMFGTVPRALGMLLFAATALQPRLCFKLPPKALWCFVAYFYLYLAWGGYWSFAAEDPQLTRMVLERFFTLAQLLILLWISYNLLQYERVAKGSLLTLVVSCAVLAVLLISGVATDPELRELAAEGRLRPSQARASVGEGNPNMLALSLSLGIVALTGLSYAKMKLDRKVRLFLWIGFGLMALAVARTGSRGALVALLIGLLVFPLSQGNVVLRIKIGFAVVVGLMALILAAYNVEAFRTRWERTFTRGDMAGREVIYPTAIEMIVEQPLTGWGPGRNRLELGSRLGIEQRDAHNLYLHLLTEMGILGAMPFFLGLWFCLSAAWRARRTIHGVLPLAMLMLLLVVTMKGTYIYRKTFWVVLAYSLASSSYAVLPKRSYVYFRTRSGGLNRVPVDARLPWLAPRRTM